MRRNTMIAALALGSMWASAPMVAVLDDDDDDVARMKRLEAQRYEQRERDHVDIANKLGDAPPNRSSVSAANNRHTGEPHEHRREIARRLRQQTRAVRP